MLQAMVAAGVITVTANQVQFTNVTIPLDFDACTDPVVQALYFQTCGQVLLANGLGLSSSADLLLTNVYYTSDPTNEDQYQGLPHQDCALLKFITEIGSSAASVLVPFDTLGSTQFTAVQNLQMSIEQTNPSLWSQFAKEYTNEIVCVNWTIRADGMWGPNYGNAGCDPYGLSCGLNGTWTCDTNDDNGNCAGTDFTDPWGEGGITDSSTSKRSTILAGPACTGGKPGSCVTAATCSSKKGSALTGFCSTKTDVCCTGSGFLYEHPGTVLSGPACSGNHPLVGRPGVCITTAACAAKAGESVKNLCPGTPANVQCCAGIGYTYDYPSSNQLCGDYKGHVVEMVIGNNNVAYPVTPIIKAHLEDPTSYGVSPYSRDNTMEVATACAFDKMHNAALKARVNIVIASGFRTYQRQVYFYNCYIHQNCNGGALAAFPGTSNHGRGLAIDVNTNCGSQGSNSPPSACTSGSPVYRWMRANAKTYGFVRTVYVEPWHWEHRPGTGAPYFQ